MPFFLHPFEYSANSRATPPTGRARIIALESTFYQTPTVGIEAGTGTINGLIKPAPTVFRSFNPILDTNPHRRYHFRFILVQNPLQLSNPPLNTDILFLVWNTFPKPDTVINATLVGTPTVSTNFLAGVDIRDFEWKPQAIQIAPGPSSIDASIVFDLTQGDATLIVNGDILLQAPTVPEAIDEVWQWVTTVTTSRSGVEQRIRRAPAARKSMRLQYSVDEEEYVTFSKTIRRALETNISLPQFQYATQLTQTSLTDTLRLYFNPSYTQLKVGDPVYIQDLKTGGTPSTGVVSSFTSDGCLLEVPLTRTVERGFFIAPLREYFLNDPSQSLETVTGDLTLNLDEVSKSRSLVRDDNAASLRLFNNRPIIEEKILASSSDSFPYELERFGSSFGSEDRRSPWLNGPRIEKNVAFRIPVKKAMATFDLWTLFFETVAGSHKAFYLPSGLEDFRVQGFPSPGTTQLNLVGDDYTSLYFGNPVFEQLQIEQKDGTLTYYNVENANSSQGFDELSLDVPLPGDIVSNPIDRVSLMYLVRIVNDRVSVDHQNNRTYVRFAVTGVPA